MELTIKAILAPFKAQGIDAGAELVGTYWQVWIGDHAGARENGVELAKELAERVMRDRRPKTPYAPAPDVMARYTAKPEPVEIPAFLKDDAETEALKAEIAALKAERDEVPEAVKEFVREGEPHGEAQARLWKLYTELTGKMMLKLATSEETRMHSRLHGALYWVSRGAVDVI